MLNSEKTAKTRKAKPLSVQTVRQDLVGRAAKALGTNESAGGRCQAGLEPADTRHVASAPPSELRALTATRSASCVVFFGDACQRFLDERMRGLTLTHLEFDKQWTYVAQKQARLTINEQAESHDKGDIYFWTCIDKKTKLMPSFRVGKRSADNARRFMMDVASRLDIPQSAFSDAFDFKTGGYKTIVQISTDGFSAYPEAVDLAFGPYAKYGTIIKDYRNANMIYTPSGNGRNEADRHTGHRRPRAPHDKHFSHVERLNGTQRVFLNG